ncbi:MAG: hypothetical protein AAFR22_23615 [Chloroflexota bacterium]
MAVELTWDDAGRTRLLMTFDTLWTWAEVRRAVRAPNLPEGRVARRMPSPTPVKAKSPPSHDRL